MVFKLADRVKETTTTAGISNVVLGGAYSGYRTFANAIGDGNQTYYVIIDGSNWEVGIGTYHSTGNLLSRDTVIESTDAGSKISLAGGTADVFVSYPAEKVVCMNPDGMVSGVGFTGYAFPDGTTQTSAGIEISGGAGLTDAITFWSDSNSLSRDAGLQFTSNTLINNHPTKMHVLSGIPLTFVRNSSGNIFQAYVDNANDRTITLHLSDESSPTWKMGLRDAPDSDASPQYGYVYGNNGSVGQYATSDTSQILNYSNGLWVTHKSANLLNVSKTGGTSLTNSQATATAFTVKGAPVQNANLQEWVNASDVVVAYVNSTGSVSGNSFRVADITYADGTANYTASFPFASGQNLSDDLVLVSGLVETGGEVYNVASGLIVNANIDTVSGSATALVIASGTSILQTVSSNTTNITNNDYDILATSGSLRADLTAASGFLFDELISSGTAIRTIANANDSKITQNINDIVTVSGIAANPVEYYDVASGIVAHNNLIGASGGLQTSISTNSSNISTNTTNISTNAANIVTASGSAKALVVASGTSIRSDVATNTSSINTNTNNISTNAADLVTASGALRATATANGIKSSANEADIATASGTLRADLTTETNNTIGASGALRADLNTVSGVAASNSEYFGVPSGTSLRNELLGASGGLQATKANLASPSFTGTPAAPTAASGTNTTQIATTSFVRTEVSNLVDSSPAALDTLNELAEALNDDPNFATTVTNSIATKASSADLTTASGSLDARISTNSADIVTASGSLNAEIISTNANVSTNAGDIVTSSGALRHDLGLSVSSGVDTSGIAFGAYAWGNHGTAGYLTTSTFINGSGTAERAATIASGTAIRSEIKTYTANSGLVLNGTEFNVAISGDNILATNSPVDNYIPSYDSATGKFTWVENTGGGGGSMSDFIITDGSTPQTIDDGETITFADGTGAEFVTSATNTVTVNSVDSEIVHDNLSGFVANEHVDHTSVTLTAGDGLSGGGDISTNRTFTVVGDSGILVTDEVHANLKDYTVQTTAAESVTTTASRTYAVQVNSSGQQVVNVPWSDTDTNTQLSTEQVQDVVGGMVAGNTETGITVTYEDGDGTLDFVIGTLNQDTTGNAATATALETARTINGTSFDGTANITITAAGSTLSDTVTVEKGGTGATTLTDGGILLGNGTGAVTAMAVLGDGVIVVGDGSTDPTTITAFTASDGLLKHEVGGLELDISAIAIGDVIAGTGTGSVGIVTSTGHSDGDVLTIQADGTVDWEAASGGASDINGLSDCLVENNSIYLGNDPSSTTFSALYNIGLGTTALEDITTGDGNVAIGYNASKDLTTGTYTVAIGYEPNVGATTYQSKMVVIGYQAGESSSSFTNRSNSVLIGNLAGKLSHVQDCVIIGPSAGQYIGDASNTEVNVVAIGGSAMSGNSSDVADSYGSIGIGYRAGKDKGRGTAAHYCIYLGFEAGYADADHASNMLYIANDEPSTSGAGGTIIKADMENKHLAIGQADLLTNSAGDGTLQIYPYEAADEAIFAKMPTSHSANLIQIQNSSGSDIFVVDSSGAITTGSISGGGEANEYSFKTISVSGQDDVVADTTTDTLTLAAGSNVTITTTAASDTVTIAATDTNTMGSGFTVSATTDTTATTITQGDDLFFAAGTGITCETTADGTVTISSTVTDTNTQLTQEQVEDYVGGMVAGNTETGIAVTYEDGDGTLDFVVSDTTVAGDSGSTGITPGDTLTIAGGSNVTTSMSGDTLTITATDTNTMGSGFTVSATTDSNATTITQGDDLMFAAGTGITCETTADGTVTISCTVTDTNTTYTKASFDVDHLFTLVGASADTDEHLSTFTGSTIADNQTIKQALQALETAVETKGTGTVDVTGTPTAGHVAIWSDADTITFDSAKLFWDTSSDELGVGTSSPGSTLHVSGSVQFKTYTVGDTGDADWSSNIHELHDATKGANHYILCDTGNTNRTVELPDASSALAGRTYVIKKIDSGTGTVTIQPDDNDGTDGYLDRDNATVDDGTNILWVQFDTISCTCAEGYTDGQYEWHIVHEKVAPHTAKIRMEGNSGNIANDTDTAIAYDTLDYAVGCGTTLTGSDRKITINRKGKYSVKVQLRMNNTFDNGERADIKLYKNGTHINTGSTIYSPATNKYVYGWLDNSFELDVDDYLTVKINHWQGENAQIFNKYYDNTTTAFDPILVVEEIK